jgi:hypothetical protein
MREDQQVQKKDNEETSKIIVFPKINKRVLDSTGSTVQELEQKVISNKIKFVDKTSLELVEDLFFKLSMMGFNLDDEIYERDNVLVSEAVKSVMLKSMGIHHDLQIAAEQLIELDDDEIEEDD